MFSPSRLSLLDILGKNAVKAMLCSFHCILSGGGHDVDNVPLLVMLTLITQFRWYLLSFSMVNLLFFPLELILINVFFFFQLEL